MIELLDAPDNVLAWKVSGTLTGADYDRLIPMVDAKLAAHPKLGIYADMTGFTDMTGEAMVKDLRYDLGHFKDWSRFPRMAMVTDKAWLRWMIKLMDPVFPQFEARVFDPGQEAEALAWVSEVPRA